MTLERDTLLHKRYRIVEILGQGGMGSVYRAVDENLGVDVAVKENLFTTDEYARQFRLEAVILANLRHPNLPASPITLSWGSRVNTLSWILSKAKICANAWSAWERSRKRMPFKLARPSAMHWIICMHAVLPFCIAI